MAYHDGEGPELPVIEAAILSAADEGVGPTEQAFIDLEELRADNARLRALIKDAECTRAPQCAECPWCQADVSGGEKHFECPAFTATGEVK
jgi:hypothetical protein